MPTREERHAELVEAYLNATGLIAILLVANADNSAVRPIIAQAKPAAILLSGLLDGGNYICAELWFSNPAVGQRVYERCFAGEWADERRAGMASGWLACGAAEALERLRAAIDQTGAKPLSADNVTSRSREAIKAVVEETERLRQSGGLRAMNTAYKQYRQQFVANKGKPKPDDYADWLHRVHMRTAVAAGDKVQQRLRFSTD